MVDIDKLIDFKYLKYNWDEIEKVPEFARLKECEQNPRWHAEGNAWVHTQAVCNEAIKVCKELMEDDDTSYYSEIFLTAALFHDIGKGVTTKLGKDGNWHSYCHEIEGEKIARYLLWNSGYYFRERVCSLVRYHMSPLSVMEQKKDVYESIVDISREVHNIWLLGLLKECDLRGSIQPDYEKKKEADFMAVKDFVYISKRLGCDEFKGRYYTVGRYPSNMFRKALEKSPITVYVLIGLAGAGKSTWIERHKKKNSVVVSRDTIRVDLGFCSAGEKFVGTSEQEAAVTEEFNKRVLEAAQNGKTIIIDNLNLKKKYRDDYKNLLKDYTVTWNYVYVETSFKNNVSRREGQISGDILKGMIRGIEMPSCNEFDNFELQLNYE